MTTTLVEDGTTYPTSISVPQDGDARNAASVFTAFQALANRTKNLLARLDLFTLGGALKTVANLTWTVADGQILKITGDVANAQNGIFDLGPVFTRFAGNVTGNLFTPGGTGRANRKPLFNAAAASQTINPQIHDTFVFTPSAAGQTYTPLTQTYVEGDWFEMSNQSATDSFQISAGGITTVPAVSGFVPSRAVMVYAGGAWRRIR